MSGEQVDKPMGRWEEMDDRESGEDWERDSPEDGDAAPEGFGIGVNFSAARFINKAELRSQVTNEECEDKRESEAEWAKG
jgi:hypothetical protein